MIRDRDECYVALQIFSHAADTTKLVLEEFCKGFCDMGILVYNDLVGMFGEREKSCLPFVNMCLCTWIEKCGRILIYAEYKDCVAQMLLEVESR
jgi:hypothetical protein